MHQTLCRGGEPPSCILCCCSGLRPRKQQAEHCWGGAQHRCCRAPLTITRLGRWGTRYSIKCYIQFRLCRKHGGNSLQLGLL
jgi:hypothetical protein